MGQWVVTVAGIAIISVLCDVILPEGQTRKYIKTVFGVVVTLVIVQPIIGLFDGGNFSFGGDGSAGIQDKYIESVESRQNKNAADSIKLLLKYKDISVSTVEVSEWDKRVTLQLDEIYSKRLEDIVELVVSSYLPDYEIITIWK